MGRDSVTVVDGEDEIDRLVGQRMQDGGARHRHQDLEQRGSDDDGRGDTEEIDQRRHQQKAATQSQDSAAKAHKNSDAYEGQGAYIDA